MATLNGNNNLTLQEKQDLLKKEAVIHAESLYHYKLIARAIGVDDETLKNWRDADPDFSRDIEQSRVRFINKKMKVAKPEFLLERLESDIFKERKEWDGNLSGDVTFINDVPRPKNGK